MLCICATSLWFTDWMLSRGWQCGCYCQCFVNDKKHNAKPWSWGGFYSRDIWLSVLLRVKWSKTIICNFFWFVLTCSLKAHLCWKKEFCLNNEMHTVCYCIKVYWTIVHSWISGMKCPKCQVSCRHFNPSFAEYYCCIHSTNKDI